MGGISIFGNVVNNNTVWNCVNSALRKGCDSISSELISVIGVWVENVSLLSLDHEVNSVTISLNEWSHVAKCTSNWHILESIVWLFNDNVM